MCRLCRCFFCGRRAGFALVLQSELAKASETTGSFGLGKGWTSQSVRANYPYVNPSLYHVNRTECSRDYSTHFIRSAVVPETEPLDIVAPRSASRPPWLP